MFNQGHYITTVLHTTFLPSNWLLFHIRLITLWCNTNAACHYDFRQTSERILAELWFEFTTPGLTARVKADIKVKHTTMII